MNTGTTEADAGETDDDPIDFFKGRYEFLSNFYRSPVSISPAGLLLAPGDDREDVYPTAEHAFQAGKTHDEVERRKIRNADLPSRAKGFGRRVKLRADWERVKFDVMVAVLRAKFSVEELREALFATGERALIEGNTWNDSEWGCVQRAGRWVGDNKLGRALTIVRAEIRERRARGGDL